MKTALAIFVKTPKLSPVMTRLSSSIGKPAAMQFYGLCLDAIVELVKPLRISVFWAVAELEAVDHTIWQDFPTLYTGEGCLGQRQHFIYNALLKKHEKVILIGTDIPQLSYELIQETMSKKTQSSFVMGPSTDGGYYLFAGSVRLDLDVWTGINWDNNDVFQQLESRLPFQVSKLSYLTDIDQKNDLWALLTEMPTSLRPAQKTIVDWVKNNLTS